MTSMNDFCRLCSQLIRSISQNIFAPGNSHLLAMISECLPITVAEDDKYPKFVCGKCVSKLGNTFEFHGKCLASVKVFDEMVIAEAERSKPVESRLKEERNEAFEVIIPAEGKEDSLTDIITAAGKNILSVVKEEPGSIVVLTLSTSSEESDEKRSSKLIKTKQGKHVPKVQAGIMKPELKTHTSVSVKFPSVALPDISPKASNGDKPWGCNLCSKVYSHKRCLAVHMETHGQYQCDTCQKAFSTKHSLIGHIRLHTGENPYRCTKCRKKFRTRQLVALHVKRYHTGGKRNRCKECPKIFPSKYLLNAHMRVHVNKQHACENCDARFRSKGTLTIHNRRHHTGEKPYSCEDCGKAFATNGELIVHKRTHTGERPYKCGVCRKGYKTKAHLTVHLRSHTGERPFGCDVCGKKFRCQSDVVKHGVTHTRKKRFQCDECDEKFAFKVHLANHKRSHD